MIRHIAYPLLVLLLPLSVQANASAWTRKTSGGVISVGEQILSGRALVAPDLPSSAKITSLSWRITLLSPPPIALKIKLCSAATCLNIPALSGHMQVRTTLSAANTFRFIYIVNRQGQLSTALNVISNELTVNYRR